jgi:hypothetical protein
VEAVVLAVKLNQLDGALCDHHRVSLHNKPGSVPLIERAGQMKIEGGICGSKLLQVAMGLAQECVAAASPLQQDVLTQPTRRERNQIPQDSVATSHSEGTFPDALTAASVEGVARIWMCFCVR